MTKKHFIALADLIKDQNEQAKDLGALVAGGCFTEKMIRQLGDFCNQHGANFDRERWINYINGTHTVNGRKLT